MRKQLGVLLLSGGFFGLTGCGKQEFFPPAAFTDYQVYDLNTVSVKALPQGGYVLQCVHEPYGPQTLGFAQVLGPDGALGSRIDFSTLPSVIDGVEVDHGYFTPYFCDVVPWGQSEYLILGLGRFGAEKWQLIVYHVDQNGNEVSPPFRRYMSLDLRFESFAPYIDVLPTTRVRGVKLANGDLAVAAVFEVFGPPTFRVKRIPFPGSVLSEDSIDFPTPTGAPSSYRSHLWSIQIRKPAGNNVLIAREFSVASDDWSSIRELDLGLPHIVDLGSCQQFDSNIRSYSMDELNGQVMAAGSKVGYDPIDDLHQPRPFINRFSSVDDLCMNGSFQYIVDAGPLDAPVQCYSGVWWNDCFAMLTNTYRPLAQAPYFQNDLESDLGIMLVSPADGHIISQEILVAGQGLRGLNLFNDGGHLVCIGTKPGYNNLGVQQTFFMKLKNPA